MIVSLNLLTVAYILYRHADVEFAFVGTMALVSMMAFFFAILLNSPYYHEGYPYGVWDFVLSALAVGIGAAIMFILPDHGDGFVYGSFFAVLGNFILLQYKSRMCMRGGAASSE